MVALAIAAAVAAAASPAAVFLTSIEARRLFGVSRPPKLRMDIVWICVDAGTMLQEYSTNFYQKLAAFQPWQV